MHTVGVGGPEGISMIGDIASKNATSTVMQELNSLVFRLEDSKPLNVHIRLSNHRFSIIINFHASHV